MNKDVPKYLFVSLQLHTRKYGKVAETGAIPVGVKVLDNDRKNDGSGNRWILVEIGVKNMPNVSPVFPPNDGEWGNKTTNNR